MQYGTLSRAGNRIDSLTDFTLAFLADKDRGFCQADDCFLLGEISETKTSNCYCSDHYYARIGKRNLEAILRAEREL